MNEKTRTLHPQTSRPSPKKRKEWIIIFVLGVAALLLIFLHQRGLKERASSPADFLPSDLLAYVETAPVSSLERLLGAAGIDASRGQGLDLLRPAGAALLGPNLLEGVVVLPVKNPSLFEFAHGLHEKTPLETNIGHPVYRAGVPFHGAVYFVYERDWIFLAYAPDPLLRVLEVVDGQQPSFSSRSDFAAQRRTYSERIWGRIFTAENQEEIQAALDSSVGLLEEFEGAQNSGELLPVIPALVLMDSLREGIASVDSIDLVVREEPRGYEADLILRFVSEDSAPRVFGSQEAQELFAVLPAPREDESVVSVYAYSVDPEASSAWREEIGGRIAERMGRSSAWERYWEAVRPRRENALGRGVTAVYADSMGHRRSLLVRAVEDPERERRFSENAPAPPFDFFGERGGGDRGRTSVAAGDNLFVLLSGGGETHPALAESPQGRAMAGLSGAVVGWFDPLQLFSAVEGEKTEEGGFGFALSSSGKQIVLRLRWPVENLQRTIRILRTLEPAGEGMAL